MNENLPNADKFKYTRLKVGGYLPIENEYENSGSTSHKTYSFCII
jgi:hypothetical protein